MPAPGHESTNGDFQSAVKTLSSGRGSVPPPWAAWVALCRRYNRRIRGARRPGIAADDGSVGHALFASGRCLERMTAVNELVAVLAAVAASVTFGASDVIEQRATHEVAERKLLDPRLFVDLLRTRLWVVGIAVDISASGLQAVALRFGPLSLVQPILVCDLLFAAVMA